MVYLSKLFSELCIIRIILLSFLQVSIYYIKIVNEEDKLVSIGLLILGIAALLSCKR